jgi:ribulose 1,5-bisphosphate carboxylase large subunit-like protein
MRVAMAIQLKNATTILAIAALLPVFNQGWSQAPAAPSTQSSGLVMVAKIDGKLTTKNAKVGDTISAKILASWKLTDGTEIPKGSKIVGKVADIKSKKDGGGNSMMSFRLDEIDVKGSAAVPVHGVVVAIGPSLAPKEMPETNSEQGRNSNTQAGTGMAAAPPGTGASRGSRSTNGIDPNAGPGGPNVKDENDIPMGSSMPGVSLERAPDADGTTILQGVKKDIDLDQDVLIKVQLK